jgi:hypothetical protein
VLRRLRGQKPRLIDPTTGEVLEVELFVAALGASNYTYAEATRTQQVPEWIASHTRAFAFFGGVTAAIVCDQLKSGVVVLCRYEPGLQRTYEEFAAHYGTAILPARPARPRDKAKIEAGVLVAERWILGEGQASPGAPNPHTEHVLATVSLGSPSPAFTGGWNRNLPAQCVPRAGRLTEPSAWPHG